MDVLHSELIKECKRLVNQRHDSGFTTSLLHVKAHSVSIGNNGADTLARKVTSMAKDYATNNAIFFASGSLS